jgi:hypothetical protein
MPLLPPLPPAAATSASLLAANTHRGGASGVNDDPRTSLLSPTGDSVDKEVVRSIKPQNSSHQQKAYALGYLEGWQINPTQNAHTLRQWTLGGAVLGGALGLVAALRSHHSGAIGGLWHTLNMAIGGMLVAELPAIAVAATQRSSVDANGSPNAEGFTEGFADSRKEDLKVRGLGALAAVAFVGLKAVIDRGKGRSVQHSMGLNSLGGAFFLLGGIAFAQSLAASFFPPKPLQNLAQRMGFQAQG